MDKKEYTTISAGKTQELGKKLAKNILKGGLKDKAVVLALKGNLGAGKTTFLQGFAGGLGIKEKILSPTFVILKHFKIAKSDFTDFYHIDCYRLNNGEYAKELNFREIFENPKNIVAIEWPEKILKLLPKNVAVLNFSFVDNSRREIIIERWYNNL